MTIFVLQFNCMRNLILPLSMIIVLGLSVSCKKTITVGSIDESFDTFYDQFHADTAFQLSRVKFPLEGEYVTIDGGESWTWDGWEPHVEKVTDISDPEYDTEITRKDTEVIDKVWLRDSGFSVERRFQKIKGRWYLVYYETVNL